MDSSTIRNPFQTEIMMEHLTKESFKNKVFDFEANQEWSFAGDKPCIIDFYADWCNPCKIVAPILENLVEEYQGNSTFTRSTPRRNRSLRQCSTSAASPPFFLSQRMASPRCRWEPCQKKISSRPSRMSCMSRINRFDNFINR